MFWIVTCNRLTHTSTHACTHTHQNYISSLTTLYAISEFLYTLESHQKCIPYYHCSNRNVLLHSMLLNLMQKHTNKSPVNVFIINNYINSQLQTKDLPNIFITHIRLQKITKITRKRN